MRPAPCASEPRYRGATCTPQVLNGEKVMLFHLHRKLHRKKKPEVFNDFMKAMGKCVAEEGCRFIAGDANMQTYSFVGAHTSVRPVVVLAGAG